MYKADVNKRYYDKLNVILDKNNIPSFIRKYFTGFDSGQSAYNYWFTINGFIKWLMETDRINKDNISEIIPDDFFMIMKEDLKSYVKYLEGNGSSLSTIKTKIYIISSFWNYLLRNPLCSIKVNIADNYKTRNLKSKNNNLVKKMPSEKQLYEMEKNILSTKENFIRIRNIAVLKVLEGTGIRIIELAGLDRSDLFLDEDIPYIRIIGKGAYTEEEKREVYITGTAKKHLKTWLNYRGEINTISDCEAVFCNKRGKRLNEDNIKAIFKNYGNGVTPHMIRHYYATVMQSKGLGVSLVQQQFGHSDPSITTTNYINGMYQAKDILAKM